MSTSGSLSFSLGEDAFTVPLHCVEEVVRAAWPVPVARAPFGCLGLLDLRGQTLPMLDTAALFALRRPLRPQSDPDALLGRQLVVISLPPLRAALLVDRVLDVSGADGEEDRQGLLAASGAQPVAVDLPALLGGSRGRLLQRVTASIAGALERGA